MALKLDMSKAYNKIEWEFVEIMLQKTGFPLRVVSLVIRCITFVSYEILINGQPSKIFYPERGLIHVDPLSPYIFILCANVLSGSITSKVRKNNIHVLRVERGSPIISHLLFADDSLLFARDKQ